MVREKGIKDDMYICTGSAFSEYWKNNGKESFAHRRENWDTVPDLMRRRSGMKRAGWWNRDTSRENGPGSRKNGRKKGMPERLHIWNMQRIWSIMKTDFSLVFVRTCCENKDR